MSTEPARTIDEVIADLVECADPRDGGKSDALLYARELVALAADRYREALQRIADGDDTCRCEHDDDGCCALVKDYCCPFCIASVALSAPSASAAASPDRKDP